MKTCSKCKIEKDELFFYRKRAECKECYSKQRKEYRKNNPEKFKKRYKEYHNKHKEKRNKASKKYREDNKEQLKLKRKEYIKKHKKREQKYRKKYSKENSEKFAHFSAERRALKLLATPSWSETDKIKILYQKAKWLESLTGLKYHVDHIIPLKGKNVCGLHVWENLQILESSLNIIKRNNLTI